MRKAESFFEMAEVAALDEKHADAAAMLFVHAGIAAADVICCARLGEHAQGGSHLESVGLLASVDTDLAGDLRSLLGVKSKASYGQDAVNARESARVARAAAHLIEAARQV